MRVMSIFAAAAGLYSLVASPFALAAAPTADVAKRDKVKATFLYNYQQYEKFAFGSDQLKPIAKQGENTTEGAGLGGTVVDALSTFLIMGLDDTPEFKRALSFVQQHDFMKAPGANPPGQVSLYEITIRYIGGMLSAYQLGGEKAEHKFLVDKAKDLADVLIKAAWVTPDQKIPFDIVNINTSKPVPGMDTNYAKAGSLILEWTTLSHYTGDAKYGDLTRKAMEALIAAKPTFPGVYPSHIYPENATASSSYVTLGGGGDSFYEYLIKAPVLLGDASHPFLATYNSALASIMEHLKSKTGVGNLTFTTDYDGDKKQNVNLFSELGCFSGGIYAYSGKLLNKDELVQFGLEIAESCGETYTQSTLGLGPYAFGWFDQKGNATGWDFVSKARRDYYAKHGFFVNVAFWLQQAEVIASLMYSHRITSQDYWRDVAWRAFENMEKYAKTDTAWAAVDNVNDESAGLYDQTGPWLFSEQFNYMYLIFDDPKTFSLEDYVFSTQGHPFKRPKSSFGRVDGECDYKTIYTPVQGDEYDGVMNSLEANPPVDKFKFVEAERIDQGRQHATKSLQSFVPSTSFHGAQAIFSPLPKKM